MEEMQRLVCEGAWSRAGLGTIKVTAKNLDLASCCRDRIKIGCSWGIFPSPPTKSFYNFRNFLRRPLKILGREKLAQTVDQFQKFITFQIEKKITLQADEQTLCVDWLLNIVS